jgi:hypothetical protein
MTMRYLASLALLQQIYGAPSLPKLNIKGPVTVSGISSGGYMATQVHISLSHMIEGAAIFA